MKEIAIIGFGNHVVKNLIPAYQRSKVANISGIFVREPSKYATLAHEVNLPIKSIDGEISNNIDWVHISTPISSHYELIKRYLKSGKNVICEKPICEQHDKAQELFSLAEKLNLKLFEVTMYTFHKQFTAAKQLIRDNLKDIVSVEASFTIPHLDVDDIRYNKAMSGGALLDVGYYPISCLVNLLGIPNKTKHSIYSKLGFEVDLSGTAIFEYEQFYGTARWAIGATYTNQLVVETTTTKFLLPRFFSKPETFNTSIEIQKGFECETVTIGADDQFVNMIDAMLTGDNLDSETYKKSTVSVNEILSGFLNA